jgi:putative peptidoglycan lipid II flippase
MSVSSAELPELSSGLGAEKLRERLDTALRRVAFLVVPSAVAFALLGDRVVALVFQTGAFGVEDVRIVWTVLAGSAVGLLAMTLGRLYASAFWALHDTRTPLRFAMIRVTFSAGLGALLAFGGPRLLGLDPRLGLAGLTLGSGLAGWLEMLLLRRALNRRVGETGLPASFSLRVWGAALGAAAAGFGVKLAAEALGPVLLGALVCGVFAAAYGALALLFRVPEASALVGTIRRRLGFS